MVKISAVIITFNEEKNIGRCIDSAWAVADEVVVVDSCSTDRTREISEARGARFFEQPFLGYARQKNHALGLASHNIVLSMDADEYLSAELTQSILGAKANWRHDGYEFNRLSSLGGTWIRTCGWYPDQKLRLWDRRKGKWEGDAVHERVEMQAGASVAYLRGDLFHRSYDNISQFLHKNQIYSTIHAQVHRYRTHSGTAKIFYKTLFAFFKAYVLKLGFLEGYKGLAIAGSTAHWVFYKYAKLHEANHSVQTTLVIYHNGGATRVLIDLLDQVRVQTELPDEVLIVTDAPTQLEESHIRRFPVPVREVLACTLQRPADVLFQSRHEYLILISGSHLPSTHFIRRQRRLAWRRRVVMNSSPQPLTAAFSQQAALPNGTHRSVAFWKEDVMGLWSPAPVTARPLPMHNPCSGHRSVTVVIPNYNGRHLFEETMPPLLEALRRVEAEHEIIVVDDCSTDDSVEYLARHFPQIRVIRNETNRGFSPTINRGIRAARMELVHLLNSDVKLTPDYYIHLFPYFCQPDTFGVMGRIINWLDDGIQDGAKLPTFQGAKIKTFKNYLPAETPVAGGILTMYLSGAEALVDREKLLALGGFDELFAPYYIEDYELSLRAWRMGWKCYYEHRSVCRHKTSSSIRSKSRKRHVQTIYYRNKMFLHAIHLPRLQMILYYPQLFAECVIRLISFRFHYIQSIVLFFRDLDKCRESRLRFEALLATTPRRRSLQQVAAYVQRSLNRMMVWRF
jgi:GT2 family glycosyltransferase